jgi:hypothetical protein
MTPKSKKTALYKTELCRSWDETGSCRYGNKCQFAHSDEEIRPVERHPKYKTELCRTFWERGVCPYGKRCCFIHSANDSNKNFPENGSQGSLLRPPPPPKSLDKLFQKLSIEANSEQDDLDLPVMIPQSLFSDPIFDEDEFIPSAVTSPSDDRKRTISQSFPITPPPSSGGPLRPRSDSLGSYDPWEPVHRIHPSELFNRSSTTSTLGSVSSIRQSHGQQRSFALFSEHSGNDLHRFLNA